MKNTTPLLTLAFAASLWSACTSSPQSAPEESPVSAHVVHPTLFDSSSLSVSGKLTAQNSAEISTRMMSFVEKIYVKPGEKVRAGQTLIRLNADELLAKKKQVKAQIATAELAAKNAKKDLQRFQTLHAQESVSDKELENMELNQRNSESQLQMARQGLHEIEAMLAYTDIKAPFAGTVTQKYIDEGSMAKPGMPLLIIEQQHKMEVTATIPESHITQVKVGDPVTVEVKTLNKVISGNISELSPSAAQNGGQYALKIALDSANDPQLLAGMYVAVRLPNKLQHASSPHLLIDKSLLVKREQLQGVYVLNADNRAMLRWLRLGKSYGNEIEVLSGLNENERIVSKAEGKLYNGRKVKVD